MKNTYSFLTLLALFSGVLFPFESTLQAQQTKSLPDAKYALLIGINDYIDSGISDLSGTENDVRLMREMLVDLYGFKPGAETKELLSSSKNVADRPTQKAILEAFDRFLVENAKKFAIDNKISSPDKGARIVFYYSGHGSHVADDNSDETDGEDETIVPMDSDVKGIRDIRDDEFDKRFAELKKYTTNITFIFDSCHSGTITRGSGRRSLVRPSKLAGSRGDGTDVTLNEGLIPDNESYVTISGSLPNQLSHEDALPSQSDMMKKVANPKYETNGLMTYFLVKNLRETPDATYRDVMKRVNAAVQKKNTEQSPQVEGDIDRVMFGSTATRGRPGIPIIGVEKKDADSLVTIQAGKIVGAYPGGAVAFYKQMNDSDIFAMGEIIESDDFRATVKVMGRAIPDNATAVLSTPYFGSNKRTVALDLTPRKGASENADAGVKLMKAVATRLEKSDFLVAKTVANPLDPTKMKDWEVAVVRSTYGEFRRGNYQGQAKDVSAVPKDEDEVYYLAGTTGNPLYNFYVKADDPQAEEKVQTALERYVRVNNIKSLGNESSDMNKGLALKIIKLKSVARPSVGSTTCNIVEDGPLANPILNPGDFFVFEFENKTGEGLFPYLYSIGTDGEVKLLYGPESDGDKLQNGITMRTWGARKCTVLRASAPLGNETFKLFAASERFDGKLLESPAIAKTRSKGVNPFENLLAQASANTRSTTVVSYEFTGWATATMDVEIREK